MLFLTPVEEKALREFSSRIKAALAGNLREVKFFGSKSTGRFHDESDLDVLIIVNQRNEEVFDTISDILLDVELKYNSKISPVVLSTSEFIKNARISNSVLPRNSQGRGNAVTGNCVDLANYRLQRAREHLKSAEILLNSGMYSDSLGRSYYAMFAAARALLALKQLDSKKHAGIISLFNQHFVKTGLVERSAGRNLSKARIKRIIGLYRFLPGQQKRSIQSARGSKTIHGNNRKHYK
ncbi:HEPN domain protein [Desulfofundulus kuznetsovii DSM 6115]|uniref:HEPN domain protein n=1 Tax=Desulfofundulus kuznetsovii (strain DSM 6115 / VKM B-1805 / 17) TaxID=760568 RepID=A0AAU8Q131_DESK7|nr:HEPN domain protein [Desulfofundulus kuznetsovii DSM 6115]